MVRVAVFVLVRTSATSCSMRSCRACTESNLMMSRIRFTNIFYAGIQARVELRGGLLGLSLCGILLG